MNEIASTIDPASTPYVVEVVEKGASSKVMIDRVSAVGWVCVHVHVYVAHWQCMIALYVI